MPRKNRRQENIKYQQKETDKMIRKLRKEFVYKNSNEKESTKKDQN